MRNPAIVGVCCLSLGLSLGVGGSVGCASSPEISYDTRVDFSRYRSWAWQPDAALRIEASASHRTASVAFARDLARVVESEFASRGLERVQRGADLEVGARLIVEREVRSVLETLAIEELSSMHASPSVQVQATVKREQVYERCRLIVFARASGQVVWRGELDERHRDRCSPHLDRSVATLLQRFPEAERAHEPLAPVPDPTYGDPTLLLAAPFAGSQRSQPVALAIADGHESRTSLD